MGRWEGVAKEPGDQSEAFPRCHWKGIAASPGAEWSLKESLTSGKCSRTGASGQVGSKKRWHSWGWHWSSALGSTWGKGRPWALQYFSDCCSP